MKKILLAALTLVLLSGASLLEAETFWTGTYWGDDASPDFRGTWNGYLYVDDPSGVAPYFDGKWAAEDATLGYGTLYADLVESEPGIYSVSNGVIYYMDGTEIGDWGGDFNLNALNGIAEGEWETFDPDAVHHGFWKGRSPFGE